MHIPLTECCQSQRVRVALGETHSTECAPSQKVRGPKYGMFHFYGLGNLISRRIIQSTLKRGGDILALGHLPLFGLLWFVSEVPWHLWVRHLAVDVLQWACTEVQGLVEVDLSTILDLVGSKHFMLCLQWLCHSFKDYVLLPFCLILTSPLTALKNVDKGPIPERELSPWIKLLCELSVYTGRSLVKSVQISLCPMSLQDPANIYLPNICFSFSI